MKLLRLVRWTLILCLAAAVLWMAGKHLLVPQPDHVWELKQLEVINDVSSDGQWALVSTVPNHNYVVHMRNYACVRNAITGALHKELPLPFAMREVSYLKFSPNGEYVWHAQETRQCILHIETERCETFSSFPRAADGSYSFVQERQIIWSPDSQRAAILTPKEIILWQPGEHKALMRKQIDWDPREHRSNFKMLFSPQSDYLIICRDYQLEIWNAHTGQLVAEHRVDEGALTEKPHSHLDAQFPAADTVSVWYWDPQLEQRVGRQYHLPTGKYVSSKLINNRCILAPIRNSSLDRIGGYQIYFVDGQLITVECRVHQLSFLTEYADRYIDVRVETNRKWTIWNEIANRFPWLKMKQLASREKHLHVWDSASRQLLINLDVSGEDHPRQTIVAASGNRLLTQSESTVTVYNLPSHTAWKGFACVCAVVLGMLLFMVYWPILRRGNHASVRLVDSLSSPSTQHLPC